jgi:hypothetical protein
MGDRLNRVITELQNTIQRIQAPNMRVSKWHISKFIYWNIGSAMQAG